MKCKDQIHESLGKKPGVIYNYVYYKKAVRNRMNVWKIQT